MALVSILMRFYFVRHTVNLERYILRDKAMGRDIDRDLLADDGDDVGGRAGTNGDGDAVPEAGSIHVRMPPTPTTASASASDTGTGADGSASRPAAEEEGPAASAPACGHGRRALAASLVAAADRETVAIEFTARAASGAGRLRTHCSRELQ